MSARRAAQYTAGSCGANEKNVVDPHRRQSVQIFPPEYLRKCSILICYVTCKCVISGSTIHEKNSKVRQVLPPITALIGAAHLSRRPARRAFSFNAARHSRSAGIGAAGRHVSIHAR